MESSPIPLGRTKPIDTGISGFQKYKTITLCYSKRQHLKIIVKAVLRSKRVRKPPTRRSEDLLCNRKHGSRGVGKARSEVERGPSEF